ncbi:sensor histidine kinase [Paenibacillus thalictri]|uniref:sensor histidine kinase n=1 Tax=Paenibacillus thalictri TaxID=2527873 RepID=UPI0013EF28A2|nr:ATP-binding protein [Paenibacillus thalictri]
MIKLPPLLIQPLVENAIRHGIANRLEGGNVLVRVKEAGGSFVFEIEDDGIGMTGEHIKELLEHDQIEARTDLQGGVGLRNIHKRLKYMQGTELSIESAAGTGTKVTIRLPGESA